MIGQRHRGLERVGFSLTELLVVIGIIAVLVGIALPVFSKVRSSARNVTCQANLRQVGLLLTTYSDANKGSLPWAETTDTSTSTQVVTSGITTTATTVTTTTNTTAVRSWIEALRKYDKSGTTATNKSTIKTKVGNKTTTTNATTTDIPDGTPVTTCPETLGSSDAEYPTAFGMHPILMPKQGDKDNSKTNKPLMTPYKFSRVKRPTEVIMVFETAQVASKYLMALPTVTAVDGGKIIPPNGYWYASTKDNGTVVTASPNKDDLGTSTTTAAGNLRFRHLRNKVGNFLFADGHVDSLSAKQIKRQNIRVNP